MKQTILIAEDEADIRKLLKLYLESEGFEVVDFNARIYKTTWNQPKEVHHGTADFNFRIRV